MRKFILLLFIIFSFTSCSKSDRPTSNTITDDLGNKVSLNSNINKVVSLAPNLTEIIYFIGANKKLVANTTYCNFPAEAKNKIKIGDLLNIDFEKLVKINPDIVFMTIEGNQKAQYEKIKSLGYRVFVSNPKSFNGIIKTIYDLGKILNVQKIAKRKISELQNSYDSIATAIKPNRKEKGLFLISVKPLIAAGKNTFINEYFKLTKINNVAASAKTNYPLINIEEVLRQNPDFIFLPEKQKKLFNELMNKNKILQNITAIKNKMIITVNPDLYFRPGPRFINAAKDLLMKISEPENE